jgi:hypothetical protein
LIRTGDAPRDVVATAVQSSLNDVAFRNVLNLATLAMDSPSSWANVSLERRDLTGVTFKDFDLNGRSFRGADLTEVTFDGCSLARCSFEESVLRSTRFRNLHSDALRDAEFGNLSRFYSITVDGNRTIGEHAEIRKWLGMRTGKLISSPEPCQVALQVRHLFGKFVEPDGRHRRFRLDRKGALAGRRYSDPEAVLDACLQYGLLVFEEFRGRIQRPDGPAYGDMVTFITDQKMSPAVRSMIGELCHRRGCDHAFA